MSKHQIPTSLFVNHLQELKSKPSTFHGAHMSIGAAHHQGPILQKLEELLALHKGVISLYGDHDVLVLVEDQIDFLKLESFFEGFGKSGLQTRYQLYNLAHKMNEFIEISEKVLLKDAKPQKHVTGDLNLFFERILKMDLSEIIRETPVLEFHPESGVYQNHSVLLSPQIDTRLKRAGFDPDALESLYLRMYVEDTLSLPLLLNCMGHIKSLDLKTVYVDLNPNALKAHDIKLLDKFSTQVFFCHHLSQPPTQRSICYGVNLRNVTLLDPQNPQTFIIDYVQHLDDVETLRLKTWIEKHGPQLVIFQGFPLKLAIEWAQATKVSKFIGDYNEKR